LHVKSGLAEDPNVAAIYAGAATKLLGEFRRCICALQDYRARAGSSGHASKDGPDNQDAPQPQRNGHKAHPKPAKNAGNTQLAGSSTPDLPERIRERMGLSASVAVPPLVPTG
jgi:hypothetical protein